MDRFAKLFGFLVMVMVILVIVYFALEQQQNNENLSLDTASWLTGHTSFWKKGINKDGLMIVVLTLEKRLQEIQQRLQPSGITDAAWFLKAHTGQSLKLDQLQNMHLIDASLLTHLQGKNTANITGCALSHITAISFFLASDATYCLILEDDLAKPADSAYKDIFSHITKSQSKSWDMLYLGYKYEPSKIRRGEPIANHMPGFYWKLKAPLGGHAYILTRKAAETIMNTLVPLKKAIDELYYDTVSAGKLTAYGLRDLMFVQDTKNIGSELGNAGIQDQFIYAS